MITFNHEDLKENTVIPGQCRFEVLNAEVVKSRADIDMIKVTLRVHDKEGGDVVCFDWLHSKALWKLKDFCGASGLTHRFQMNTLEAQECIGKHGDCIIENRVLESGKTVCNVKKYILKPEESQYAGQGQELRDEQEVQSIRSQAPDSNQSKEANPQGAAPAKQIEEKKKSEFDDGIPF